MRISFTVELSPERVVSILQSYEEGIVPTISVIGTTFSPILAPPWKDDLLPPRWLNLKDAERYCGLSAKTLQRASGHGAIKSHLVTARPTATKKGGTMLIDRLSLDDWIESERPGFERIQEDHFRRKRQVATRAETRRQIEENKAKWAKDPQT